MKIKILFPIILEIHNETNDFLFVILKTILAKAGIHCVKRIQQLKRGMSLTAKPEKWNELLKLGKSINWFATKRESDMVLIGPLVGYFLRYRASHFCRQLDHKWKPLPNFSDMADLLIICEKSIKPVIVELDVVEATAERLQGFVHVSSPLFDCIAQKQFVSRSKHTIIYLIKPEYEDWAWDCLHSGDTRKTPANAPNSNGCTEFIPEQVTSTTIVEEQNEQLSAEDLFADSPTMNEGEITIEKLNMEAPKALERLNEEDKGFDSTSAVHNKPLPDEHLIVASNINIEERSEDLPAGLMALSRDHLVVNEAPTSTKAKDTTPTVLSESFSYLENKIQKIEQTTIENSSAGLMEPLPKMMQPSKEPRRSKRKLSSQGASPSTTKIKKKKKVYRNTRSQRTATVPRNATFEWVNVGNSYRPAFIHRPQTFGSTELAQLVTTEGDTGQKVFLFSRVSAAPEKASKYLVALAKFNSLYGTNYE